MTQAPLPLGVFAGLGEGLDASLAQIQDLNVPTAQVHAPPTEKLDAQYARQVRDKFEEADIDITLIFCGYPGESYASIQAVRETVGLVPEDTRHERVELTRQIADFARETGAPGIGLHVGFIPEDWDTPEFAEIVGVVKGICEYCRAQELDVNLETGQETAQTLHHFIEEVGRPNLGINFDPANMIIYGSGDPLPALSHVGQHVSSCHCKDATWSDNPGEDFGVETPLGQGDVDIRKFISTLVDIGYRGPLTIEREVSGQRQIDDIRQAITLLKSIRQDLMEG